MLVRNKTAIFTPSKTYKTQANLQKAIAKILAEMDSWDAKAMKNMGQLRAYCSVSYVVSVTEEGRFFPIFLTKGFGTTVAHYIIENGFCVEVA